MRIDYDAMSRRVGEQEEENEIVESRCYTVRGPKRVLNAFEKMVRRVEWLSERGLTRVITVFADGRSGGRLRVRALAQWTEEEPIVEEGAPLPTLEDEDMICSHYVVDIG